jgi:glycosyltransferase involved in cell wall biosynthesis
MKVLLVTKQALRIIDGWLSCDFAISSTIKRFQRLGELYLCCSPFTGKVVAQPLDMTMDIPEEHIALLNSESSIYNRYLHRQPNIERISNFVKEVDLVIGYVPSSVGNLACKIARRQGKKYMAFVVACPWDSLWNHHSWRAKAMAPLEYLAMKKTLRHSDYAWYVTEEFLQQRYPTKGKTLGYTDSNLEEFDKQTLDRRLRHIEEHPKRFHLMDVGNLDVGFKCQDDIIKALPELISHHPDTHLYLIGGGEGKKLRHLTSSLKVDDHVHFMGSQTRDTVLATMDNCDIYIQPSLQEGLPRSIAEAMSRAMPCIGSTVGGIPEMLEKECLVSPRKPDKIVRAVLSMTPDKRKEQAIRNFHFAKKYQSIEIDRHLDEFFDQIRQDLQTTKA